MDPDERDELAELLAACREADEAAVAAAVEWADHGEAAALAEVAALAEEEERRWREG